jgi:hypothetical protein
LPFSAVDDQPAGTVAVAKPIRFALVDAKGGSALASKTIVVYNYTTLEEKYTLTTDANGLADTPIGFNSGTKFYVYYESSNDKQWFPVTVPYMNENDAKSLTVNTISLDSFAIGTYTSDMLTVGGTSISDAGSYNHTASGDTPTFSYTLSNSGSDNTGLVDSKDPVYNCDYQTWVTVTFSGTNYEKVVLDGFDRKFTLGSTQYGCDRMSSDELTLWKQGSGYKDGYEGTDTVKFSLNLAGYSGSAVTMQITVYAYADPDYALSNGGSFGPEIVEIAEQTLTLES